MKLKVSFLLPAVFFLGMNSFSQNPNFHIYLAFGQSNMEGQGAIEVQDQNVEDRFKSLQALNCPNLGRERDNWYAAVPPTCQCWSGLSPVDYFGRTMLEEAPEGVEIGVINVAVGGCDIRLFDKDLYRDYDDTYTESWFVDKVNAYEGNPYQYLIERAKVARKEGVIKGILLHQGETNTGDSQWPQYVKAIYNNFMADLSLDPDSVPLLAGEVVHAEQNGCCSSMNNIIANLPSVIPNAYVISSKGCSVQPDNTHFNSEGYRELGRRYAEKMLTLINYGSVGVQPKILPAFGYALSGIQTPNMKNITFDIPRKTTVSLKLFTSQGNEIAEMAGAMFSAGRHSIDFRHLKLSPGSYYYTMQTEDFSATRKLILLEQ